MSDLEQLFKAALKARLQAYVPYSKFAVGAAVLGTDAKIYAGCNVENVSFPCSTCAEAGAIAALVSGGCRTISQILIVADSKNLITPCGACLQRIAEFAEPDTLVHLANLAGVQKTARFSELLPLAFDEKDLRK